MTDLEGRIVEKMAAVYCCPNGCECPRACNLGIPEYREEALRRIRASLRSSGLLDVVEALRPLKQLHDAYPRPRQSISAEDTVIFSFDGIALTLADLERAATALAKLGEG